MSEDKPVILNAVQIERLITRMKLVEKRADQDGDTMDVFADGNFEVRRMRVNGQTHYDLRSGERSLQRRVKIWDDAFPEIVPTKAREEKITPPSGILVTLFMEAGTAEDFLDRLETVFQRWVAKHGERRARRYWHYECALVVLKSVGSKVQNLLPWLKLMF